jgi:bisphosphoglycerate-dependent phosphoglycerate mutase
MINRTIHRKKKTQV